MPIFMIERHFADELDASADDIDGINRINDEEGVRWLYSFLSADKRKTYCLYEAPSPDAIRRAATRAGLPADVIVEVTDRLLPDGASTRSDRSRRAAMTRRGPRRRCRRGSPRHGTPPLVGRGRELETLETLWADVERGTRQVALRRR